MDAIHVVARGEALLSPSITRRVIEQFVSRPPDSMRKPPAAIEELTSRELEMLRYLARGLRDRVQAVVFAYEHGIVEPGSQQAGDSS